MINEPVPVCVTGRKWPLPTTMREEAREGRMELRLPELEVMWEDAPVSRIQSEVPPDGGGCALCPCRAACSGLMSHGYGAGAELEAASGAP